MQAGDEVGDRGVDQAADLFGGDEARAGDAGRVLGEQEDGGFDAGLALAAVEHEDFVGVEGEGDVLGGGGGDGAGEVGTGADEGAAELAEQFEGERVIGAAHGDVGAACGDDAWDDVGLGEDEGEGAWPEVFGEDAGLLGPMGDDLAGHGFVGDVDDEGVLGRAAFEIEDAADGCFVGGVGAEAVDGFGGEGDDAAGEEAADGEVDDGGSGRGHWGLGIRDSGFGEGVGGCWP